MLHAPDARMAAGAANRRRACDDFAENLMFRRHSEILLPTATAR